MFPKLRPVAGKILAACTAAFLSALTGQAEQVVFTEVMYHPADSRPEFIEVRNLTSNRLDMAKWKLRGGVSYTFPDFNAGSPNDHFLREYERIVISAADPATTRAAYPTIPPSTRVYGPWTGSLSNGGDSIRLDDAAATKQCELNFGDSGKWPVSADGAGHSLVVVNEDRAIDDWRNWQASRFRGGSPGNPEVSVAEQSTSGADVNVDSTVTLIDYNKVWRWTAPTVDPGTTWMAPAFDDSVWGGATNEGKGILGFKNSGTAYPRMPGQDSDGLAGQGTTPANEGLRTLLPKFVTGTSGTQNMAFLFRTTFTYNGPTSGVNYAIDQFNDDGVIYWLNGQRLGPAVGMAETGAWNRTATRTVGTAAEELASATGLTGSVPNDTINGGLLLKIGTNVLAAQVNQVNATSSDVAFAVNFKAFTPTPAGLVINEVKPSTQPGQGFVEFYNPTASPIDLQGYYLSDSLANLTQYQVPTSIVVPPSGFASVGFSESGLTVGAPTFIVLTQPNGTTRQAGFSATVPTDGRSIGRKPAGGSQWYLFAQPTPGQSNASSLEPPALRLNEAHFAVNGNVDWVEFANTQATAASGTGLFVASDPDFSDKVALPGSVGANGFASVPVNFATDGSGDITLYFIDSQNNVLGTVELTRRAGLPSVQRWPLASNEWYNAATATQNAANSPSVHGEIVITEIMAAPPSSHEDGEFIELYNRGASSVSLAGWSFADGISFDFPLSTTLAPGQYLVVAKNPAFISANYGGVTALGPFSGTLRNSGELIRLHDESGNLADWVDYKSGGQWPSGASGEGSSLELLHPDMDNSLPSSWRASDESNKTTFQTFTHTGVYRELRGSSPSLSTTRELLINLVSDGHAILKNIKLTRAAAPATNVILTGDATSHTGDGANGFRCTGTHCLSDTLADGFHLISTGSGDTKANKAEVDCTAIVNGDTLTLSFEGRWVTGLPLMVAQTWDRSFGKVFRFPVPNNLGTPGAANSIAIPAPAPTVDSIAHSPVVPTSSQPVVVTARVSSAAALSGVELKERIDNANGNGTWNTLAMNDSGTNGDAVAADGVYSTTVAARADGTITQFYVVATSSNGRSNDCPRSGLTKPAMWIVDNTPATSTPGILAHRYILSQFHRAALKTDVAGSGGFTSTYDFDFPRMSNYGFNATIIIGEKDVFHNCELRKGGSPWTRTASNPLDRARWKPPGDNVFRNRGKTGLDNDAAGASRFHNRIVRYMLYLFGYPVPDSEFVQQIVNTDGARLGDDQEQTDSDFFDRAYDNGTDGELFEIDDAWFMYDTFASGNEDRLDAGSVTGRWSTLDWNNLTAALPSDESPIFYHGNWPIRFPEDRYDYSALSSFIKTAFNGNVNPGGQTQALQDAWREKMERQLDIERTAIYAAVRGYVYEWDNFTGNRGKNGYFYRRPTDGKFEFHHWDSDLAFQDAANIVVGTAGGVGWTNLTARPYFRRMLNFYLDELLHRYTKGSPRMQAWIDANNYQASNGDGLAPFKQAVFSYPTWFTTREARIVTEINTYGGVNYTRPFSVSTASNQSVASPIFALAGEAPTNVWQVAVAGHPEAVFAWVPTTANNGLWSLSNLILPTGVNSFNIQALGSDGGVIASVPFTVTVTGNANPIVRLTSNPASMNVALNEPIVLDATASTDPEGGALTYAWSVTPTAGATIGHSVPGKTEASFTVPGVYTVTVTATDPALNSSALTREIVAYNAADFRSFANGEPLGAGLTVENMESRDNFSPTAWYSVQDVTGRLEIQILDDSAKPLGNPAYTHPLVTRPVPASTDFVLQTDLELVTRETGNFQTGLWLETTQGGVPVRYAFAVDGGTALTLYRANNAAAWVSQGTAAFTGLDITLRIRRAGTQLFFDRRVGGAWVNIFTQTMAAGSTAVKGGAFVATSLATAVRVSFDYLLVVDPSSASSVLGSLRLTEIMYNPTNGGVEYLEFANLGTQPINLNGVSLDEGRPFAAYVFGAETLAPGEFICLTDNVAGFQAKHGTGIRLAAPWTTGGLNNGGERIVLRDAQGNIIHDFDYHDSGDPTWPAAADGQGPSLEVIDPNGNYGLGSNWRASGEPAGSPGFLGVGPDSDGDGVADGIELRFGTDPNNAGSQAVAAVGTNGSGEMVLSWPSVSGRSYRVERSADLTSWSAVQTVTAGGSSVTFTDTSAPANTRFYYRIVAL